MKNYLAILVLTFSLSVFAQNHALVIHGGAGNFTKEDIGTENEKEYTAKLNEALNAGDSILKNGGTALEAVEKVIMILEDSPLFNAGKGAVFTSKGTNELDASIMDGKTLKAGAVAGVGDIKNPICAAKEVMLNSEHVLLTGKGASEFAKKQGLEIVDSSYFFTQERWDSYLKIKNKEKELDKKGTVGCVALDKNGNLAAGTSTGGMTNKKYGRVGDSPIIGAGTYADNQSCGVSCTGHGEYFIRYAVAFDINALMKYKNMSLKDAAAEVVSNKLVKAGGEGGIIAIDKNGNVVMEFNTTGMFRGYVDMNGKKEILLFKK